MQTVWALQEADCLDAMSTMETDSVDLTLTDPPYEDSMHAAKSSRSRR